MFMPKKIFTGLMAFAKINEMDGRGTVQVSAKVNGWVILYLNNKGSIEIIKFEKDGKALEPVPYQLKMMENYR